MQSSITSAIGQTVASIRGNRRLQLGLLVVVLIVCGEGGMRWNEHLAASMQRLEDARGELRDLRKRSGNEDALRKTLGELRAAREDVDRRLWVVSSEALGQARLKDWLLGVFKKTGVPGLGLKIANPRPVTEKGDFAAAAADPMPASAKVTAGGQGSLQDLRELRATLSIGFTPADLEKLLAEIEGGEAIADVENLTVSMRDRRAELTVRVLARLGREPESDKGVTPDAAPRKSAAGPEKAAGASRGSPQEAVK